jgi:hypothetical protein
MQIPNTSGFAQLDIGAPNGEAAFFIDLHLRGDGNSNAPLHSELTESRRPTDQPWLEFSGVLGTGS